jgi:hypothetical protein
MLFYLEFFHLKAWQTEPLLLGIYSFIGLYSQKIFQEFYQSEKNKNPIF